MPTEPTPEPTVPTTIDYRLPETLVPSHYDIDLRPHYYDNNPENFWFEGNVTIHLACVEATSFIYTHTRDVTVNSVEVTVVSSGENIQVRNTEHDLVRQFFIITLARTLVVGEEITVAIMYEGKIKQDLVGIYYSHYEEAGETK